MFPGVTNPSIGRVSSASDSKLWPSESKTIQVLSLHYVRKGGREAPLNRSMRKPGQGVHSEASGSKGPGTRPWAEGLKTAKCMSRNNGAIESDEQATD